MTFPDISRMKGQLACLVAFGSENLGGREIEVARYLGEICGGYGFDVAIDEYRPGRANIVATLVNDDGPILAFNTHMDVVPAGEG